MDLIHSLKTAPFNRNESISYNLKEMGKKAAEIAEKEHIRNTLAYTNWNRKAAARLLQVSYKALLYKIDRYDLTRSQKTQDHTKDGVLR